MFITVCGQKGGVAKTCTSIHLASVWHSEGKKVCIVDADKNRSALAYSSRGNLPFPVFPVSSAAKASRSSEIVITDGQASSDTEELKHLAYGSDLVILPTTAKARSVELTVELASLLNTLKVNHAVVIVKVDFRQQKAAQQAPNHRRLQRSLPLWKIILRPHRPHALHKLPICQKIHKFQNCLTIK